MYKLKNFAKLRNSCNLYKFCPYFFEYNVFAHNMRNPKDNERNQAQKTVENSWIPVVAAF